MLGKFMVFLSGAGLAFIGGASYFANIPLPINCKSTICIIGTSPITLDIALMGVGALLILFSMMIGASSS